MIKTKYAVGDVVVVNGKQLVVYIVSAIQRSLYTAPEVTYWLSDGDFYDAEDLV